jgi:hypothetical protein
MHGLAVLSVNPQASGGAAEGGTEKERGNADAGRTATAARSRKAACHFAIALTPVCACRVCAAAAAGSLYHGGHRSRRQEVLVAVLFVFPVGERQP